MQIDEFGNSMHILVKLRAIKSRPSEEMLIGTTLANFESCFTRRWLPPLPFPLQGVGRKAVPAGECLERFSCSPTQRKGVYIKFAGWPRTTETFYYTAHGKNLFETEISSLSFAFFFFSFFFTPFVREI